MLGDQTANCADNHHGYNCLETPTLEGPMLSQWWEWEESNCMEDYNGKREWTLPELWGERETAHQRWGDRPGDED